MTEREAEGTECEPLVEVDLWVTGRQLLPLRQRPKGPARTSRGETCGETPRSSLGVKAGPLFMRKGVSGVDVGLREMENYEIMCEG